jgi:hypothetical protein
MRFLGPDGTSHVGIWHSTYCEISKEPQDNVKAYVKALQGVIQSSGCLLIEARLLSSVLIEIGCPHTPLEIA